MYLLLHSRFILLISGIELVAEPLLESFYLLLGLLTYFEYPTPYQGLSNRFQDT